MYCIDFERLILGAEIRKNKILSRNVFQYLRNRDFIILLSNRIITPLLFFIIISIPSYIWILEIFIPIRYYHSRKWLLEGFVGQETVANPGNVEARSSRSRGGGGTKEGKRYRRKVSTLRLRVRSTGSIPNRLLAIVRINKWHGRGGEGEGRRRGGQRYLSAACKGTSRTRYFDDRRMHATAMTAVTTAYLSSTSFVGQWVWNRYHPSFCTLPHIFSRWWKTFLVFGRGDPFFSFFLFL